MLDLVKAHSLSLLQRTGESVDDLHSKVLPVNVL
jgi:hypothetical protein